MASNFSLPFSNYCNSKGFHSEDRLNSQCASNISMKEQERHWGERKAHCFLTYTSKIQMSWLGLIPPGALSSMASNADSGQGILEDECSLSKSLSKEMEFDRVNCLVWVLHESARSFSLSMQRHELVRTGPAVAMAWNGVDVHAWHKHIAYQVATYALLEAAIEVELFLSHNRSNNPSPVHKTLSPNTNFIRDHVERQLTIRNTRLVEWFRVVELPRLAGLFMPLFKKWSLEYAGSGVAGTITAITCCAAVRKLGPGRISCSVFSSSVEDALIELMSLAHDLVSIDKLYHLASEAGFEHEFLSYSGTKILPTKNIEDLEFWIGLIRMKLSVAFQRESVTKSSRNLLNKVQENNLATVALFAYLGRESRLFLLKHDIDDIDEQTKDFLSYLECGVLFIYPQFSVLSVYQLLMEVVVDELGWLDFFASYNCQLCQDRRRSKHQPIQAEKEIMLYTVYTVCYDVISGFAHYNSSTQQTLDADLLEFLLQSQGLLSTCLEDYWAAYDRTSDLPRIGEMNAPNSGPPFLIKGKKDESQSRKKPMQASSLTQASSSSGTQPETLVDLGNAAASKSSQQNFVRKSAMKLVAASIDIWMGSRLLFVDISDTLRLSVKELCGHKVTKRERKKMQRTIADIATLIPVIVLMLIPVSAVGHAAMLAAIKKYAPCLIPSPYSDERLNLMKQFKRTKKMEVQLIRIEDTSCKIDQTIQN